MIKHLLVTALLASVLGGVATYAAGAARQTVETEVRINAQRLDDGRVEFALQQRDEDGAWSDRQLPSRRFFPASGFLNRWANSTPITVVGAIEVADVYVNNTQPTRTLSLNEYVEFCSDPSNQLTAESIAAIMSASDGNSETATWGEFFAIADGVLSLFRSINPPAELGDWHQGQILGLTLITQYAYLKPSHEALEPLELLIPGLVIAQRLTEVETNLDAELRERLTEAGCIDDASG